MGESVMGTHPPEVITLLAHDVRWNLVRALAASDYRAGELVARLGLPANLVSYHLKLLREGAVVTAKRSEADGRDTYYSLNLDTLRGQMAGAVGALHPVLAADAYPAHIPVLKEPLRVLFLCTHNSARSQMAEGLMRTLAPSVTVASAGSEPMGVHPDAARTMDALGVDISEQGSRHLDTLAGQRFDTVITVCDRVREVCPTFPGVAHMIHWSLPDPAAIADASDRREAFRQTARTLRQRIEALLVLLAHDDSGTHS
jgi:protein-tyrosine-phosphatase